MKHLLLLGTVILVATCIGLAHQTKPRSPAIVPQLIIPSPVKHRSICAKRNKPLTIAVIDTGFGYKGNGDKAVLCQFGHKNFTDDTTMMPNSGTIDPVPMDYHGHGTNIAGIIQRYADYGHREYCIVVLKYYSPISKESNNLRDTIKAITYATDIGADYINYSGGGLDFSKEEYKAVERYLSYGGRFVAAAGNEYSDLKISPYYPGSYDYRIFQVGSLDRHGKPLKSSNYGETTEFWELGENVKANGISLTGTSQATAVKTGKLVAEEPCKK